MSRRGPKRRYFTIGQVAGLAGVSRQTVYNEARAGRLDLDDFRSVCRWVVGRELLAGEKPSEGRNESTTD